MLPCKKLDNVKTLEGICVIVYVYVRPLVMLFMLWLLWAQRFNLKTLSYRYSREVQDFLSNPLGEIHKNVVLHIRTLSKLIGFYSHLKHQKNLLNVRSQIGQESLTEMAKKLKKTNQNQAEFIKILVIYSRAMWNFAGLSAEEVVEDFFVVAYIFGTISKLGFLWQIS